MDEYLVTLKLEGRDDEVKRLQQYREEQKLATQKLASDLRSQGKDVNYRDDGGIEFNL